MKPIPFSEAALDIYCVVQGTRYMYSTSIHMYMFSTQQHISIFSNKDFFQFRTVRPSVRLSDDVMIALEVDFGNILIFMI